MAGIWLVRGQNFEMAWQILFMGGMMVGYYWQSLIGWTARWPKQRQIVVRRGIYVLAGVTFIMSYLSVFVLSELNAQLAALPGWLASITQQWDTLNTATWPFFEKWTLEPGRIIVFGLWFMAGYLFLSRHYKAIPRFIEQAFVLLGQNSLFVYGLHSVVIFMLHLIVRQSYVWWINAFISLGVLMIIISVTTIYKGKMSFTVRGLPRFDRPRVDI
jgi:fucose 4-O-acetylase-like acetyltransferase